MERQLTAQTQVYYDLYLPDGYRKSRNYPLLIALHGYSGNKESMLRLVKKINDTDLIVASLNGPYRFIMPPKNGQPSAKVGFGWHTHYHPEDSIALHHKMILAAIADVSSLYRVDRKNIFLLGFSQPVSLNYRFILTYPKLIRGVVAICGGIPSDLGEKPYFATTANVLHIAGATDEFYSLERTRTFKAILSDWIKNLEFKVYQTGHSVPRRSIPYINTWLTSILSGARPHK
jgi:phospholipase/carboxylesterase